MTNMTDVHAELTALQNEWLERIRACEASGLSVKAFAEREGLDKKRLYEWRKTLTKKGVLPRFQAPRFQRAEVVRPGKDLSGEWRVDLPNGVSVTFAGEVNAHVLAVVLNTAAQLR